MTNEKNIVLVLSVPTASQVSSLLGVDLNSLIPRDTPRAASKELVTESGKRYVYGLRGIQGLFNVSHATAQKYKDGILKDAVYQSGRTIVVDADKALELFNSRNGR